MRKGTEWPKLGDIACFNRNEGREPRPILGKGHTRGSPGIEFLLT